MADVLNSHLTDASQDAGSVDDADLDRGAKNRQERQLRSFRERWATIEHLKQKGISEDIALRLMLVDELSFGLWRIAQILDAPARSFESPSEKAAPF